MQFSSELIGRDHMYSEMIASLLYEVMWYFCLRKP